MKLICEHVKLGSGSVSWIELGLRGWSFEIMVLPGFYIRFGKHPRAYELAIDADGARVFTPQSTYGFLWPWK